MEVTSFNDWWNALTGIEQAFWGLSIVSSVLFVIQFVLSVLGLEHSHDHDFTGHSNTDNSLDGGFTVLSVRSLIAFFTFFGWAGVLTLKSGATPLSAVFWGSIAGLLAMFLVAYIIYLFSKLQENGSIDLQDALFTKGEVYLTVPANKKGNGKVHLKIKGSFRELDAVTEGRELRTGVAIRVLEVLEDNTLLVEPVER